MSSLPRPQLTVPAGGELCGEYEEKRSRFLCYLQRASSEAEAREFIATVRRRHPEARHHCSAFIVAVEGSTPVVRSNDDGEPSGTAGIPMLDQLQGAGLSDVVAVVVRWFGGTKLGTGGLVRAYSAAVADAVRVAQAAGLVEVVLTAAYECVVGHEVAGRLEADLRALGVTVVEVDYGARVRIRIATAELGPAAGVLASLTSGGAEWERVGRVRTERPVH